MQHITIYDFLLLPVYLTIFYIIIKKRSVKYTDPIIRNFFIRAFLLRMLGSILYSLVVQYYYGYGDSFTYYTGNNFIIDQVKSDPGNLKYFFASGTEVRNWYLLETGDSYFSGFISAEASFFVMKICAVLSLVTFNKFLITSLFFGLFSFIGQWKLFLVFNDINKQKNIRLLGYAILYTPLIWFWGSGLMKDSVCLGALGFVTHYIYKILIKKKGGITDLLLLLFMVYLITNIKSYITIIFGISLVVTIFSKFLFSIKNVLVKSLIILIFLFLSIIVTFVSNFTEQVQLLAEESQQQAMTFLSNYEYSQQASEDSKGLIKVGEIDASVTGLLQHTPSAIFTCLYRPFIWESSKIFILLSALESTLLLIATLYLFYLNRFFGIFKKIFSNEYLLFCFIFSMLFALIIGFTTFNFGTMIRYKIMFLPFFYFLLIQIYSLTKKGTAKKVAA